jgi:two-component system osmolarity sensor histidine kinase EnvZ
MSTEDTRHQDQAAGERIDSRKSEANPESRDQRRNRRFLLICHRIDRRASFVDDTRALLADIADMERLLDEFLAFARGDALEENVLADPAEVLRRVVAQRARIAGAGGVKIGHVDGGDASMMRPDAVARALDNLIGNAQRYGSQVEVSLQVFPETLRFVIEDNGPGIPKDQRIQAAEPFARLDAARNPNQGGGVGLGLAIATDIARSHGGELILGASARLGGLRAELRIAR